MNLVLLFSELFIFIISKVNCELKTLKTEISTGFQQLRRGFALSLFLQITWTIVLRRITTWIVGLNVINFRMELIFASILHDIDGRNVNLLLIIISVIFGVIFDWLRKAKMTHFWGKILDPNFVKTNYTILILLKF